MFARVGQWAMIFSFAALSAACAQGAKKSESMASAAQPNVTEAVAHLEPLGKSGVDGTVTFVQKGNQVLVKADLSGLKANSTHGFHVHEHGDCSAADGTSAGGHYNPQGHPHAGPEKSPRHAGDMGNLKANSKGTASFSESFSNISLLKGMNPIVGRAVVVHAGADDLESQPSGDAGSRIACGVIGVTESAKAQ